MINLAGCAKNQATSEEVELTVSAAASLQDALTEIGADFSQEYPDIQVNYNFGGSGSLQQQITQGAPVDLYFSAAEDKFALLLEEELIDEANSTALLQNQLVLITPKDSEISSFAELSKAAKISIGTPASVPAGKYAKETLENLKIWNTVEEKMVYAKDVRQVLAYVDTGNVDAGIVYQTDALVSQEVEVVATAEADLHTPIVYPVGIIKNTPYPEEAEQFYEYLQSEHALEIFENYGFKGLK
nr:molybdate ABC transporter substrate-binding protein [Gracilibacillus oryzae]